MKNADVNFLCRSCAQELKDKLKIVKETRPDFLKNLIFLEIKDKSLVELKEEYDIKIVLYLRCANRHFGLFVKSTLFDKRGIYKDIVLENVVNNSQSSISNQDSFTLVHDNNNFDDPGIIIPPTNDLTTPNLNEANMNFMKNMDHKINQLGVMHLHNMKHMTKMRRNFLIVLLVLIVLAATGLAGGLGLYFTISKEVASAISQQNFKRIDLSTDVKNLELGELSDNKSTTILQAVKEKNPDVVINDVLLKNISQTQAVIFTKAGSTHYKNDSKLTVEFLVDKITLKTHLQKQIISSAINTISSAIDILNAVKIDNPQLVISELNVTKSGTSLHQAIISVNPKRSMVYIATDQATVYLNVQNKKLLTDDLTDSNLGDILDNTQDTIRHALQAKNPYLKMSDVIVSEIISTEANVSAIDKSNFYISDTTIRIYYRVYNPHVGTIKKLVETNFKSYVAAIRELKNGQILAIGSYSLYQLNSDGTIHQKLATYKEPLTDIFQLSPDTLLIPNNYGTIYVTDLKGTIKKTIVDEKAKGKNLRKISKLNDGRILLSGFDRNIFELNPDGSIKQQLWSFPTVKGENTTNDSDGFLIQLKNGNILGLISNSIFQVGLDGTFKLITQFPLLGVARFTAGIQLQDGTILVVDVNGDAIQLNEDGSVKMVISPPQSIDKIFFSEALCQLHDGTILVGTYGDNAKIYELNHK
ncbi:hypothetical protein [Spiroplasma sp. DGKH1]|uniref:hypothetical protein n=1 Tax=Spiroplasma sp. DGKH1 TaxID=3050074 RepID=UPI0034C5ED3A